MTGIIAIPDLRSHSKWKLLTIVDWKNIHPSTDVWDSIRKKYQKEIKDHPNVMKTVLFRNNITPEEALQICRLTKAGLAKIQINRTGQITTWGLIKQKV